jgi:hypothetical protein
MKTNLIIIIILCQALYASDSLETNCKSKLPFLDTLLLMNISQINLIINSVREDKVYYNEIKDTIWEHNTHKTEIEIGKKSKLFKEILFSGCSCYKSTFMDEIGCCTGKWETVVYIFKPRKDTLTMVLEMNGRALNAAVINYKQNYYEIILKDKYTEILYNFINSIWKRK